MEQLHYGQWVVEEEQEELEQSLQHRKNGTLNGVGVVDTINGECNGVCLALLDEPLIQKEEEVEEMVNGVENGNHFSNGYAAVGLGVTEEIVGAATNEEGADSTTTTIIVAASQNKNSVHFDKQEGMWKCHHCSWTKRFDSFGKVSLGNLKGYPDLLMNVKLKTVVQHGPCFVSENKGNEFNGLERVQNGHCEKPVLSKSHGEGEVDKQVENSDMQNSLQNETNNKCVKTIDDRVPFVSELSPLQNSSEVLDTSVENLSDESSAKTGPNLTEVIDQQLKEFDVEAVLAKQETHDLFCPNCKSCITKRVILKKRKRNINKLDTKAKRDKLDTKVVNSSPHEANQDDQAIATSDVGTIEPPPADNYEPEREPEVFRCLSCFSFFIPLRNGIKLFPNFSGARVPETSQNPSVTPASNVENPSSMAASKENWFFSLFNSNDRKKAHGQGDSSVENSRTGPAEHHKSSSSVTTNVINSPDIGNPEGSLADTATSKSIHPTPDTKSGHEEVNSPIPSTGNEPLADQKFHNSSFQNSSVDTIKSDTLSDMGSKRENVLLATVAATGKHAKDAVLKPYEEPLILKGSKKDVVNKTPKIAQNNCSFSVQEPQSPAQSFGNVVVANAIASDKQSPRVDATILSDLGFMKMPKDIEEEIKLSVKQEPYKSSTSQIEDNVPDRGAIATEPHTQIHIGEEPRTEIAEPQEWEILKSVVYGGLVESITSLGIVSSAASSGAAPLNIIALGLANLIGGLFVIGHDLIELKKDHSEGDPQQTNMQEDRYQELLGRRSNFMLHAVVAVLSFLIFGSVPVVVYGILIRKNYYAEVKFAAVLATCIVCIILLAIGKAYTRKPPKSYMKTVLQYVTLAVATSGVSYVVGDLVKDLLDKLNRPESGPALIMPFSSTTRMAPAWTSF